MGKPDVKWNRGAQHWTKAHAVRVLKSWVEWAGEDGWEEPNVVLKQTMWTKLEKYAPTGANLYVILK